MTKSEHHPKFKLYGDILKFGFRQVLAFRTEVWFIILSKFIKISSIAYLWTIALQDPGNGLTFKTMFPYFLVADSVQVIVYAEWAAFGRMLIDEIKSGALNSHLLHPVNPVIYLYLRCNGKRALEIALSGLGLIIGILLRPPTNPTAIALFLAALIVSLIVSFLLNVLVGSLSFWLTEPDHLRSALGYLIRFFGGALIPITLFPSTLKKIILSSPIPIVAYLPASLLQPNGLTSENITALAVSCLWLIGLTVITTWVWQKGLRRYEAIGI